MPEQPGQQQVPVPPQYGGQPSAQQPAPLTSEQLTAEHLKVNPLAAMQEGEEMIADIHRHPFGIVSTYIFGLIGFAAACGVILLLTSKLIPEGSSYNPGMVAAALIGIVLVMMVLGLGVTTMIYWQNRWVVTSDSVTQITQRSLFDRQISQLSLSNLEDVTAEQRGIIQSLFNFGTLRVETAGERSKFYFLYCPDPNLYARKILMAREVYLQNNPGRG